MAKRWGVFMAAAAAGLSIAALAVRSATPKCDNTVLERQIEGIEQLASRSSTLDEAWGLAVRALVDACEGEPAWVPDDLEWEFREDWAPDRTTSGRARWWIESALACDLEGRSVRGFDGRERGVDQCGFGRFVALEPAELEGLDMLDLDDTSFGFWAAGAMFERHGADPELLRRYYRVLLLGLDVANANVNLVIGPERIYDTSLETVLDPGSGEFERRIEHFAGETVVAIEAQTPAGRLAWSRVPRDRKPEHWWVEIWMLEARLDSGLPVRTRASVVDRIAPSSQTLQLEREGWRWGAGELRAYEHFEDGPARAQRRATFEAGTGLVVVVHADVRAARFMPILAALWREQTASGELRPALTIAFG